jgi:hypothetical protein
MNMKNNPVNSKFLIAIITYSVICIILVRHIVVFDTINYNFFKKRSSEIIVTPTPYTSVHSNKLSYSRTSPLSGNQVPTLSRGYIEDFDKNSITTVEGHNYENDLYTLSESALIDSYYIKKAKINLNSTSHNEKQVLNAHLPDYLMYKNVNITNLKEFLKSKNSLLAEDPYLLTILSVSEDFNLNPLVMFAITGQEQSFVPKSNENAVKIANNPFNVFGSWKKYNTTIQAATTIAARTVVNLCKDKPDDIDAFTWINRKYSEDENWSRAVRSIFIQLEGKVSYWK